MPGQGSPSLHRHLDLLGTAAARGREGGKGRPLPFSTFSMKSALQAINPLCSPEPCPEAPASSHAALPPKGRLEHQLQRSYGRAMLSVCPTQPLGHH